MDNGGNPGHIPKIRSSPIATRTRGPRTEASTGDEISFHTPMDMLVGMSELFKSKVKEYKDSQEISVCNFFIDHTLGLFKVQLNDQDSSR